MSDYEAFEDIPLGYPLPAKARLALEDEDGFLILREFISGVTTPEMKEKYRGYYVVFVTNTA